MLCSDPQTPDRLYHYCSERGAADIVSEEPPYFVSGGGSHHGWGMYATDIEPVDADSIAEVSTSCFMGEATLGRPSLGLGGEVGWLRNGGLLMTLSVTSTCDRIAGWR
jgi:hypothetical protein